MKGKIFIGWCGANNLAVSVGEELKKHDYECIIGGNHNRKEDFFIGETIIKQLKSCNQSIFLIEKNDKGAISNNVMFEIGYSLSKFNLETKKMHMFYIDIESKDPCIPSDLLGAWAFHIESKNKTISDMVELITSCFFSHQKIDLKENKMDIVNAWHTVDDAISKHYSDSLYSDYELAQYLMLYAVSSGLLGIISSMKDNILLLKKNIDEDSAELYYSFRLVEIIYEVDVNGKHAGNKRYIDDITYHDAVVGLTEILELVEKYKDDIFDGEIQVDYEFKPWFLMIGYQRMGYVNMMYANNPLITEDEVAEAYREAIRYSKKAIELCNYLERINSKNNKELATQYRAFCNRNISIAYRYFDDTDKEYEYKISAFNDRKYLKNRYKSMVLDARLQDRFEREYYLLMAEILKFVDDPKEKRFYTKEITAYTEYMLMVRDSSNLYVNRIKLILDSRETDGV